MSFNCFQSLYHKASRISALLFYTPTLIIVDILLTSMSKQVRLPEEFIEELRQEYQGKNDMDRLKAWKNEESAERLVELINKVDEMDVNDSSTSMNREYVETIVEEKIKELKQRNII